MESLTEKQKPGNSQLIFVPRNDTIRLLEVYVKRSLSLNDSAVGQKRATRKQKWVTLTKRPRRSSSDPSLHLAGILDPSDIGALSVDDPMTNQPKTISEESEKPTKKPKKKKKPSFWKSFLGFFSLKSNEDNEEEQDCPADALDTSHVATTDRPSTPVTLQKKPMSRKSLRRRFSKRRLSSKQNKLVKDLNPADITGVEAVISVEPTYSYYEKVSEELEKIVHEVKEKEEAEILSDDEITNRIIALTKEQGDAIDDKLKDNPALNNFFQKMSYSSFQRLADAYLEKETTPTHTTPTVLPTAPELVKLAFTLDFTARIAGLSKHNLGHITCLGNRYLQDRFEYKQACTDHPWSDSDD